MARVSMRRVKDGVTRVSTNSKYLADIMHKCNFCKHERTSSRAVYFLVDRDLNNIPQNIYDLPSYFRKSEDGAKNES